MDLPSLGSASFPGSLGTIFRLRGRPLRADMGAERSGQMTALSQGHWDWTWCVCVWAGGSVYITRWEAKDYALGTRQLPLFNPVSTIYLLWLRQSSDFSEQKFLTLKQVFYTAVIPDPEHSLPIHTSRLFLLPTEPILFRYASKLILQSPAEMSPSLENLPRLSLAELVGNPLPPCSA